MSHRSLILFILAGGAVMAPLFAFGHACEFLVARLEVKNGTLQLEITADYGGNPLLADEAAAREALRKILQVRSKGQGRTLEELSPLKMERRTDWDPQAPTAFAPAPDGQPHQLLTALWQWRADVADLTLAVPEGSLHDVLLWTRDEHLPGKQAKWMMLIEGESTPQISISRPASWKWLSCIAFIAVGLGLWLWRKSHTSRLSFSASLR
ncbi:hypothetical protein [Prosthecobacter dejongeii]|uniref:Transmembrane protein n=1 Tax=Prosthecobacter dejongeii TaxID=48465 RepID=A0A7W8DN39_9BACT|nr:hypothetical protein [Prosthecobacter dejongeii]MBB5035927.1 hypothetical protein [Prosthecobacter dejongeii]